MKHRLLHAIAAALVIPLFLAVSSPAETYIWAGPGNAAISGNWYAEGTGMYAGIPGNGDSIVFDNSSSEDCTWDLYSRISTMTVLSGYTGTIRNTSGFPLQVTTDMILYGGSFDLTGYYPIVLDGNLKICGSTPPVFSSTSLFSFQGSKNAVIDVSLPSGMAATIPAAMVNKQPAVLLTYRNAGCGSVDFTQINLQQGVFQIGDGSTLRAGYITCSASGALDFYGAGKTLLTNGIDMSGMLVSNSPAQVIQPWTAPFLSFIMRGSYSYLGINGLTLNGLDTAGLHVVGGNMTLNNVTFNGNQPGGTAITIDTLPAGQYVFDHCTFAGTTMAKNIALAAGISRGSVSVLMTNASGARAGATYENDPNGIVYWSAPALSGAAPVVPSSATIDWQWVNDPEADGYRISQTSSGVVLANLPAGTTHFLNAGLTANTTCTVYLSAYNPIGTSTITLTGVTRANAPLSVGAIPLGGNSGLMVSWGPGGNPEGTEYFVRCSTDAAGFGHASSSTWTTVTMLPFDHLISGATYYFQAKARNYALVETPFSAIGAAKSGFDAPGSFTGTVLSTGSIEWSWTNPNNGEAGFKLCTSTGGVITDLPPGTTRYTESNLLDNTSCTRAVTVYFVAGDSMTTTALTRCTLAKLPDPASLAVSSPTPHALTLSWSRGRESAYRIAVSSMPGGPGTACRDTLDASSAMIDGLLPATTYYFFLSSYNGSGVATTGTITCSGCTLPPASAIGNPANAPYDISAGRTSGGVTLPVKVEVPQGTVNREIYIDINLDPLAAPREADPARIIAANAAMTNGERCLTDTITEFNMYSSTGDHISGGFTQDVTIRLPYRDEDNDGLIDGLVPQARVSALRLYTLNEATGRWELVASTIDTANHQVVALVRHFSVYTLGIGRAASRTLGGVKVYPNPFTPGSRASGIAFAGLTARAHIRIYTVAGELVFEATDDSGTGTYNWQAVNSAGNRLASGVYIYIISNPDGGEQVKGKLAIIR